MKKLVVFSIGLMFNLGYSQTGNVSMPATAGTGGNYNSFYGAYSGGFITGDGNTLLGYGAGLTGISGADNVCVGRQAGNGLNTGSNNTYIGAVAGTNGSGSNNVVVGKGAGFDTTTSNNNIALGAGAGYRNKTNPISISDQLFIDNSNTLTPLIWGDMANDLVKLNGKVGIGFVNTFPSMAGTVNVSAYSLFVNGGILTEEVRVSLNSTWADYVFKKDYKLPTLKEVENHIAEKGHLINVPSAAEVKANGIGLGEMSKIQQEKIEELTLYIIEQNKINEKQSKEIEELKALVKTLVESKK